MQWLRSIRPTSCYVNCKRKREKTLHEQKQGSITKTDTSKNCEKSTGNETVILFKKCFFCFATKENTSSKNPNQEKPECKKLY